MTWPYSSSLPLSLTLPLSLALLLVSSVSRGETGTFSDLFQPYWAPQNIVVDEAEQAKLSLDASSGDDLLVHSCPHF